MFRQILAVGLLLAIGQTAIAEPVKNPDTLYIQGRYVQHSLVRGTLMITAKDAATYLGYTGERSGSVDVLELAEQSGYKGYWTGNHLDLRKSYTGSSTTRVVEAPVPGPEAAPAQQGGLLVYAVRTFTADTGFVRAKILVRNEGDQPSDPSEMVCLFQDSFGKTYARDSRLVPTMAPGASEVFEIYSVVRVEDTSMTITNETVAVNFYSTVDPSANPVSEREKRQQQRARKRRN